MDIIVTIHTGVLCQLAAQGKPVKNKVQPIPSRMNIFLLYELFMMKWSHLCGKIIVLPQLLSITFMH